MTKLILILSLATGAAGLMPRPASATDCTREYARCLNDSYDLQAVYQSLADIECAAAYTHCVVSKLMWW